MKLFKLDELLIRISDCSVYRFVRKREKAFEAVVSRHQVIMSNIIGMAQHGYNDQFGLEVDEAVYDIICDYHLFPEDFYRKLLWDWTTSASPMIGRISALKKETPEYQELYTKVKRIVNHLAKDMAEQEFEGIEKYYAS